MAGKADGDRWPVDESTRSRRWIVAPRTANGRSSRVASLCRPDRPCPWRGPRRICCADEGGGREPLGPFHPHPPTPIFFRLTRRPRPARRPHISGRATDLLTHALRL